ncbi:MAG TPA: cupredoxin domain-containing protein [Ktedonobacteraceae bacterium]|nr:cupredoxin domain-containing protein [Ktedonobacteraceae bacterium]
MVRKWLVLLALSGVIALLLAACDIGGSASSTAENPVHMNDTNFVQASITIKKGERLTLIDDAFTPHIVANGTWENGTAHSAREPGAPLVKDVQINGTSSQVLGPFTTTGTYKLYCTIHSGMNLTVVVQ